MDAVCTVILHSSHTRITDCPSNTVHVTPNEDPVGIDGWKSQNFF